MRILLAPHLLIGHAVGVWRRVVLHLVALGVGWLHSPSLHKVSSDDGGGLPQVLLTLNLQIPHLTPHITLPRILQMHEAPRNAIRVFGGG